MSKTTKKAEKREPKKAVFGVSLENSEITEGDIIGTDLLCKVTGMTDSRHRQLAKTGLFPSPVRAKYDAVKTLAGIIKHIRELQAKAMGTLEEARLKQLTAERHMAELKLAKERKEALDAEAVFRAWENVVLTIRQKLLALPSKTAPRLAHLGDQGKIEAELEREVTAALVDLAKVEIYGDDAASSEDGVSDGNGGSAGPPKTTAKD